jgi:Zn-dependent peptidase ImmA (M78 family)/predicted secreted protein
MRVAVERALRKGSQEAQRELRRLQVPLNERVRIFEIIERAGIWLMFQPLDNLYGFYHRRPDGAAGIVIHAAHPLTLQRSTAAHEYGHHVLKHDVSLDPAEYIEKPFNELPPDEAAAQSFAANFLMPLQLVNRVLPRVGLERQPAKVSAEQAYELSVLMGTSYQGTVNQLQALHKITWRQARVLCKEHPIEIKTRIADGRRPENARADVWLINEIYDGEQIAVRVDDEIHVTLLEQPTAGARWLPHDVPQGLQLLDSWRAAPTTTGEQTIYGQPRMRHLWFRATDPGLASVSLVLARPQNPERVAKQFRLDLAIDERATGASEQGVSRLQKRQLVAA